MSEGIVSECIETTIGRNNLGYGRIRVDGKQKYTHRHVFELSHGEIPEGMCVCHRCDNPSCINIDHLFLGTHQDNMKDRDSKERNNTGRKMTTRKDREEMRLMFSTGSSYKKIAEKFGFERSTISKIINSKRINK